nr:probable cytochrome P450 6a20 [Onthophagus taurus]
MEVLVITLFILITLIYVYYKNSFQYWDKKGITTVEPSFPFGNLGSAFFGKGFVLKFTSLYKELKEEGAKYGGLYAGTTPIFLPIDPEIIKNILCKDFQYFHSRGSSFDEKKEPLQANLFNFEGKKWKECRIKSTPTFSSGKMKMMFHTVLDCGKQLEEFLHSCHKQQKPLDIKEIMACFTTDVIGSCAFGVECDSFKNPNAQFRKYGRKALTPSFKFQMRRILTMISPFLVKFLRIHFVEKDVVDFFIGVIRDVVNYRLTKNVTRNDFLQILIDTEKQENSTSTIEQLAAQAFVFFIAGFETSSTVMTFALYELAHHQDIQDRLRKEIIESIQKNGSLTYEGIHEMKYLDQVVNETIRKYPTLHTFKRLCVEDYKLDNNHILEKGTKIFISILGLHRDEEYFPNPDLFNPERFSEENKSKILPYTYLPFGEGPRNCIGLRFGLMQTKVGLCILLGNYKIFPHHSVKYPIEFDNKAATLAGKGTILLTTEKI